MTNSSIANSSQDLNSVKHEHLELVQPSPNKDVVSPNENEAQKDFRTDLARILNSHRFHIVILALVLLDCFLVFGELIIDLKLFQNPTCHVNSSVQFSEADNHHTLEAIEKAFHYSSVALLGLFVLEVFLKLIAFGYTFFYKFEELIDATIILVSFVLDIIFINNGLLKFMGALIFLRMWRIVRIVHAIITTVMTPMEHRIEQETKRRISTEVQLKEALQEIEILKKKLIDNKNGLKSTEE